MAYYVYILQSLLDGRFYIGQTQNLRLRLESHYKGLSTYTANFRPWQLVWCMPMQSRKEAMALEKHIKKLKSRERTIRFMAEDPCVPGPENPQISDLLDFRGSS